MKPVFYASKEDIRNRILKNAQDFWNIKNSSDFDPLVKLIIEVLGNELFNISNDVKNLENRIFDKLSRILAPDHLTSALPAHAIMHAQSLEKIDYISPQTHFSFKKSATKDDSKNDQQKTELFFSPLHRVKVHHAEIKYLATGKLLSLLTPTTKSTFAQTLSGFSLAQNTLYIGLSGLSNTQDLGALNLFFDWKNFAIPDQTYELLSLCRCYLGDKLVPTFVDKFMDEETASTNQAPFQNKQLLSLIKADVLQYYSSRFLTLDQSENLLEQASDKFPDAFKSVFQPETLNRLEENITWLKLVFPAAITQEMLNELYIYINAFPVVNKKLYQIKHRLKTMNNIVPIKTEDFEQLLAIEKLQDNNGKSYNEIPYTNENDKGDGSYSIRFGGTERFDSRSAKELVDYLFELLRDEKAAFAAYGPDFLNTALKNLEQNISLIEQKSRITLKSIKELPSYVVVKPIGNADIMFLDIWITQGEEANRIAGGSKLSLYENNKLYPDSLVMLTPSKGGRARLNATNRVQAYKYGLTTADRIVTKSDIINFCKYELGEKVKEVSLEKGLMMGAKPNSGFVRTTDIIITPKENLKLSAADWNELLELTTAKLKQRSTLDLHFRLLLKSGA